MRWSTTIRTCSRQSRARRTWRGYARGGRVGVQSDVSPGRKNGTGIGGDDGFVAVVCIRQVAQVIDDAFQENDIPAITLPNEANCW